MPTFRTLFSGGCLFDIGAQSAGYTHIDGYEIEPKIAAVARRNGFDVRVADVCEIDYESLPPVDHLHASPSCKHASHANVGAGETQGDIDCALAVCRAIRAHQGRTVSLENVWPYRNFESFARILAALHAADFVVDFRHINAADYGVPQTRKRLILRAVRRSWRETVPPLHPTHRQGGDMFHAPWVGWYAAIEDLIPTLPLSQFAPWQLARLPELHEDALIRGDNANQEICQDRQYWRKQEPSPTVGARFDHAMPRAFLVHGTSTMEIREDADPAAVCVATVGAKAAPPKAFLVDCQYNNFGDERGLITRNGDDPSFTCAASASHRVARAWLGRGRVVRMTVQALGRFQTVPDDYVGLTAEINGNGIPCLLARRMMESF